MLKIPKLKPIKGSSRRVFEKLKYLFFGKFRPLFPNYAICEKMENSDLKIIKSSIFC